MERVWTERLARYLPTKIPRYATGFLIVASRPFTVGVPRYGVDGIGLARFTMSILLHANENISFY